MTEKDTKNKVEGTVIKKLPDANFMVKLDDGKEVFSYLAGKMRLHYIKVMVGDRVLIELGSDKNRGRIIYRK